MSVHQLKDGLCVTPWGAYNTATLSPMREFNAAVGVTTEVRMANISNDNPLTLPRFNTNDFPQ